MKLWTRILAVFAALVMLSALAIADDVPVMEYKALDVKDEQTLRIAVYAATESDVQPDDFTVMMDAESVKVSAIDSYEEAKMGTTWLYVVDLGKNDHAKLIKQLMTMLIKDLGPNDNAAIIKAGMPISEIKLTSSKNMLQSAVDNLKADSELTITNVQIATALMVDDSLKGIKPRTNIVVLSNGQTNNTNGKTQEELQSLAEKSDATIYTVSFLPYKGDRRKANTFGTIARVGGDGLEQIIEYGKEDLSAIMLAIDSHENRFRVLEIPTTNTDVKAMTLMLKDGNHQMNTSFELTAEQQNMLKNELVQPTPEPTATPAPTATPEPTPEPGPVDVVVEIVKKNALIIGAVAVLVVLVTVLIVMKTRKPAKETEISSTNEGPAVTELADEPPMRRVVEVTLAQTGSEQNRVYTARLDGEVIVGREPSQCRIAIPDKKISGRHLKLVYRDGVVYAEDQRSTNGTKINGNKIAPLTLVPLNQQDMITIGLTNVRVTWRMV